MTKYRFPALLVTIVVLTSCGGGGGAGGSIATLNNDSAQDGQRARADEIVPVDVTPGEVLVVTIGQGGGGGGIIIGGNGQPGEPGVAVLTYSE